MTDSASAISSEVLGKRLQRLIFLRALFASFLLVLSLFIQFKGSNFAKITFFHYALIAAIYLLTFLYVFFKKALGDPVQSAYTQLLIDTFIITAMIYGTGGIESPFSFFYILTIITASIMLYRKGGMIVASSSSILYGLILDLHFYGIIEPVGSPIQYGSQYLNINILFMIVMNIAAFYLVAFLSSFPSEQEKKSRVELQAKQEDLVKLEILNERIIHNITSGLITIDKFNRIILFNPAAEKIFNLPANEAVGRNILELLPFISDYLKDEIRVTESKSGRSPFFIDKPYQKHDGKTLHLRFSISALDFPDLKQRGWILVFQDMTEMKQIEKEMKKVEGLALVGELAAGMAHEIRNPMASISGSIQMLKEGLSRDYVNNRLMEIVLREVNRLNHLVNDFLLFARPKQTDIQDFDLNQVITESLDLFQNSDKWNDKITIKTEFSGPIRIKSDQEKIKQVLWNLFINAMEAMLDGGRLLIRTEIAEDPDKNHVDEKKIKVIIRDTGKGFSQDALFHLFTPFFTTKEGGSGLGLAIVKRIIEALQGKIYGQNHAEGGAEITIYLPFEPIQ